MFLTTLILGISLISKALPAQEKEKAFSQAQKAFEVGFSYHEAGNLEKAREYYERAIAYDRTFVSAYINLGNIESQLLRYDIAENYYKIAISLNPHHADAYYNLGALYQLQEKYTLAIQNFEKTISLNNNYKQAYVNLATCYMRLYLKSYDRQLLKLARESLVTAGKIDRQYGHVYFNLGMLYELENQPGLALSHYRQALRYYDDSSPQQEKTRNRILYLEKKIAQEVAP
ncbi:MAG: tetratricopeptide repeat protein [Leptospiraceae bacterium]|nr:tetratricopeptide repeat protein [Leptospiraceae bacterium]MDW8306687.1 tetratricopeptide repeat protein [Leptospiraceae bacterium]